MSKKRKQYSPQFKAKVAIEAIQGRKLIRAFEIRCSLKNAR